MHAGAYQACALCYCLGGTDFLPIVDNAVKESLDAWIREHLDPGQD